MASVEAVLACSGEATGQFSKAAAIQGKRI